MPSSACSSARRVRHEAAPSWPARSTATRLGTDDRPCVSNNPDHAGLPARGLPVARRVRLDGPGITVAREGTALQAAVLLTESLKGIRGIELEVYAHTSCTDREQDCLVRYLYGRKNPVPAAIGSYSPKSSNYDHQAILTAARLFEENTVQSAQVDAGRQ